MNQNANQKVGELSIYDDFEILQEHWKRYHASKKFQFFAIGIAECFYCSRMDTFQRLQLHHDHRHQPEQFAIVDQQNRTKCGLCQNILHSTEMAEHFKRNHEKCLFDGIFNPICFTQNEIDWLLKKNPVENVEMPGELEYMVCGHCKGEIDLRKTTLKQHLENDSFQFHCCPKCKFVSKNINQLVSYAEQTHSSSNQRIRLQSEFKARLKRCYNRTKLVFSNGLVLFKHNILNTKLDDRKEFFPFFERFAEQKFNDCNEPLVSDTKHYEENTNDFAPPKWQKPMDINKELSIQRNYKNNICISGVAGVNDDINELLELFVGLCKAMELQNVSSFDVKTIIVRAKMDIIVRLKDFEMKKMILQAWKEVHRTMPFYEKLNLLVRAHPGLDLKNVSIGMDLTNFFRLIWREAEEAKNRNKIYSYWISEDGIYVKVNFKSKKTLIWSKSDLMKLIYQSNA